jgi:hypothetical protein
MTERIKEIRSDLRTIHQHQSESAAEQMADTLVGHVKFLLAEVARLQQYADDLNDQIADCRVLEYQAKVARVEALAGDWERMAAEDDPEAARWFRYAARNVRGRLQEPPAALAEPERDEEGGR